MKFLNTKHKKKSAVITSVILLLLLLGIFNYGMRYLDPPLEYGVAINYGVSNLGKGIPKVVEKIKSTPKQEVKEEKAEEVVKEIPKETVNEEVVTQPNKEAPSVEKSEKKEEKEKPKKEIEKKPKPKAKKPSKSTLDAFKNLMDGDTSDGEPKGEGDDNSDGIKGKENGDPKSSKYYGNTGSDGDPNYNLAGRKALQKPIQKPTCEEEGIVVVSIEVNKNGRVIKATPGVKGTTNSTPCLLKPAREAALKTKWNAAIDAPEKQRGTIIYKFTLTK